MCYINSLLTLTLQTEVAELTHKSSKQTGVEQLFWTRTRC